MINYIYQVLTKSDFCPQCKSLLVMGRATDDFKKIRMFCQTCSYERFEEIKTAQPILPTRKVGSGRLTPKDVPPPEEANMI